jgi:hypothetical protein
VQPSGFFESQEEEEKYDFDDHSSFVEDTLSNDDLSDSGIEDLRHQYKLNVFTTNNVFKTGKLTHHRVSPPLERRSHQSSVKRGESFIERIQDSERLESISGKEMALHYLRRNLNTPSSHSRMTMVSNSHSNKDFKNDLIKCLNVPEHFKLKQQGRTPIFRSQSLPKSIINNQSIGECKYTLVFWIFV